MTEAALWSAFKERGCQQARAALIQRHTYLVSATRERAVPRVPPRIDPEDLHGAGLVALVESVDRFDPARGVKFTSYAISRLRGAMLELLRKDDWVPRSVRTKQRRGEPVEVIHLLSLEDMICYGVERDGMDDLSLAETLPDPAPGPEEVALERIEAEALWQAVSLLPQATREVVRRYYWGEQTLKRIAGEAGKSESRIHQRHAAGLQWLREEVMQAEIREWTAEEEARLIRDYGRVPMGEIAAALGRTEKAVRVRASVMRRRGRKPVPIEAEAPHNGSVPAGVEAAGTAGGTEATGETWVWTPEQDEGLIRALAAGQSHGFIAVALGRSKGAIAGRIAVLRRQGRLPEAGEWMRNEETPAMRNGSEKVSVMEIESQGDRQTAAEETDPEIAAMALMLKALGSLDGPARGRVMSWAQSRFEEAQA